MHTESISDDVAGTTYVGYLALNPEAGKLGNPAVQYHEPTDKRSWRAMLDLFGEIF